MPEYFELDAEQIGLLRHVKGAPRSVLNLPIRIDLKSEIDEDRILEAMRITAKRLPFCTVRLHELEKKDTFVQYYYDGEPEGLEVLDYSKKKEKDITKYMLKQASASFPNNCSDSQLWTFKLFRTPEGGHTIFFCGYHLIMDSVGIMIVISYFDKVYAALTNGTELPEPGVGIEKLYEESWAYKKSAKEQRDIDWWCEQFVNEPHFSSMNPRPSAEYVKEKNYGKAQTLLQYKAESMPMRIPGELVEKVNVAALNMNLSPQLYFALALRTYLSYNSGSDDVTIGTTGARRATNYRKKCGMTMAHMVSWRSEIDSKSNIKDALVYLDVTLKNMYKHISVDMADYLEATYERHGTPSNAIYKSVVFTYQPYFTVENINLEFSAEHINVGLTPYPLYLNLMPRDASSDLWADYIYASLYLKKENIIKFHEFMLKFLEAAVNEPDVTIEELKNRYLG